MRARGSWFVARMSHAGVRKLAALARAGWLRSFACASADTAAWSSGSCLIWYSPITDGRAHPACPRDWSQAPCPCDAGSGHRQGGVRTIAKLAVELGEVGISMGFSAPGAIACLNSNDSELRRPPDARRPTWKAGRGGRGDEQPQSTSDAIACLNCSDSELQRPAWRVGLGGKGAASSW